MASDGRGADQSTAGREKELVAIPPSGQEGAAKGGLLTEGKGVPPAGAVGGANPHDMKLAEGTLQAMLIERPEPATDKLQNLCLDKGYNSPQVRQLLEEWGHTAHIRARGEASQAKRLIPGYRARW